MAAVGATILLTLASLPSHSSAQAQGTLDIGGSVVEYDGFLVSGAAVIAPAIRFDRRNLSLGAQGTLTMFESGNQIAQAAAAGAWLSRVRAGWQFEVSGSMGVSKYANAPAYGHALARTRVHLHSGDLGIWASGETGWAYESDDLATPFALAIGGWALTDQVAIAGTATHTWVAGASYFDLVGAMRWSAGPVELDAQLALRPWTSVSGESEGGYADVSAIIDLNRTVAATLRAGRSAGDPARALLGAKYVTVGLRLNLFSRPVPLVPTITSAMARAAGELATSGFASRARLEIIAASARTTIRLHAPPRARTVEVMGDFTDWEPVQLTRVSTGIWELRSPIVPGVHRLNVRIDGGDWLVPLGARLEETEFGGPVGIVVIP